MIDAIAYAGFLAIPLLLGFVYLVVRVTAHTEHDDTEHQVGGEK